MQPPGTRSRWAAVVALATLSGLLAWLPGYRLDLIVGDWLAASSALSSRAAERIVVVGIDEATLAGLAYRSPLDRSLLANLVAKIDAAGARAIGIDILLDQATEPDKDRRLREVLANAKSRVVVAHASQRFGLTDKQAAFLEAFTRGLQPGHVELVKDGLDGGVRWFTRGRWHEEKWVPGFAAALAGDMAAPPAGSNAVARLIPAAADTRRPFGFAVFPAHAVALLPDSWFAGRYVLIGANLPNDDRHRTPFAGGAAGSDGTMPGVLLHAHALAHILEGRHVREGNLLTGLAAALGAALGAALVMRIGLGPWQRVALLAGLFAVAGLATVAAFETFLVIVPLASLVLGAAFSGAAISLAEWAQDRRRRVFTETAFARYVGPEVAREIAARPEMLRLGGERRTVTVVFTDLEGFTSLSERLPPEQLVALLNSYLDGLCGAFLDAGATIDKIVGDAVVGFFGAPREQPDQACRAAALAIAIDAFSERFRAEARERGIPLGLTRIGIHKGEAVVGNFGGERFFDYTGIGDTVNTAARLEAANRHFGTRICASSSVAEACPGHRFRPIGSVRLKGKNQPVACFELVTTPTAPGQDGKTYDAAFELISTDPAAALAAFEALLSERPEDGLISFQIRRLREGARDHEIETGNM